MPFDKPYYFGQNNLVIIKHKGDKYLRINPEKKAELDVEGGTGKFAHWRAEKDGDTLMLKSNITGKYLRIKAEDQIDVRGEGGKFCVFKVHGEKGQFKLESTVFEGRYLAIGKDNEIRTGGGGKWCELEFSRDTTPEFEKAYYFGQNNVVVIQHKGDKFLRVNPEKKGELDPDGGKGKWAQWEAEKDGDTLMLKNVGTGKYARIKSDDQIDARGEGGKFCIFKVHGESGNFKLESTVHEGRYLAVGKDNEIRTGSGGPWCEFRFLRKH